MPGRRTFALACVLLLGILLVAGPGRAEEEERPLWLVVTRPELADALKPLADHRREGGLDARVATTDVPTAIREAGRQPAFLVLVGDEEVGVDEAPWRVPAPRAELYRWRATQSTSFAADSLYGDVDADLVPDIPVGRIPARTADEVRAVVRKILAFEARTPSEADLRLVAWAGAPGYGGMIDRMATGLLVRTVRSKTPSWCEPFLVSADPVHPLAGWPPEQPDVFDRELRRGALLGAIVSHANAQSVVAMRYEGTRIEYDVARAKRELASGAPAPPLVILACECAAFDFPDRCLAEALLFLPAGPVATIAATTESHPLTNFYTGRSLLERLGGTPARLGTVWLETQRAGLTAKSFLIERMLKDAEGSLEPEIDVAKLRRDQPLMHALLGDPALRLHLPVPLEAEITATEDGWRWKATRPPGATHLSVGLRAPESKAPPPTTPPADAAEARARFTEANAAWAFVPQPGPREGEPWAGVIEAPVGARLRLVATGPGVFAAFAADLEKPADAE